MSLPFGSRKSFCPSSFIHLLLLLLRDGHFWPKTAKPTLKTLSLCLFSFPSSERAHVKLAWQRATWCLRQSGTLRGPQLPEPIPAPRTPPAGAAKKTTVPWRARIKKTYTEDLWSRASTCRRVAVGKERETQRKNTKDSDESKKSYALPACGPQTRRSRIRNGAIRFNQQNRIRSRHHILENSQQSRFTCGHCAREQNLDAILFALTADKCWVKNFLEEAVERQYVCSYKSPLNICF